MRATLLSSLLLTSCALGSSSSRETYGDCPSVGSLSSVVIDGAQAVDLGVYGTLDFGVTTLDSQAELDEWVGLRELDAEPRSPSIDWNENVLVLSTATGGGCVGPTVEWKVVESGDGAHVEVGVTHLDGLCRDTCDMVWASVTAISVPRTAGGTTACMRYRKTCEF